jgi:G:T/U-mismatch repair DNA glycosylase
MYGKYGEALTGIPAIKLPSTSPANAAFSLEKLAAEWGCILEHL